MRLKFVTRNSSSHSLKVLTLREIPVIYSARTTIAKANASNNVDACLKIKATKTVEVSVSGIMNIYKRIYTA